VIFVLIDILPEKIFLTADKTFWILNLKIHQGKKSFGTHRHQESAFMLLI